MRWLDKVLKPLEDLPEAELRRLKANLELTLGPDSAVLMKDVCGRGDEEALEVFRWVARVLLRAGTR